MNQYFTCMCYIMLRNIYFLFNSILRFILDQSLKQWLREAILDQSLKQWLREAKRGEDQNTKI